MKSTRPLFTALLKSKSSIACCAALLLLTCQRHASAAEFIPFGDPPGGYETSFPAAISADGMVVTGAVANDLGNGDQESQSVRWTRESGLTALGHLPGGLSSVPGLISADGSVIVGYEFDNLRGAHLGTKTFRWTTETGMVHIVPPPDPVTGEIDPGIHIVDGMSDDGSVLAGDVNGSAVPSKTAWRWEEGTGAMPLPNFGATTLTALSADGSTAVGFRRDNRRLLPIIWTAEGGWDELAMNGVANDVSADGSVVVGHFDAKAALWTTGIGERSLGVLPGYDQSAAVNVSSDGSIVFGGSWTGRGASEKSEYFHWSEETGMVPIGLLPGDNRNYLGDVSADGSVLIGRSWDTATESFAAADMIYWTVDGGLQAFTDILNDHGLQGAVAGWQQLTPVRLSADGLSMAGFGINPDGVYEGWLIDLHADAGTLGDTDRNGMVNIDDLNNVRNHFGDTGPDDGSVLGDSYSFDGLVNIDDLNAVRNHFGAGTTAVPEPASSALALVALLGAVVLAVAGRRGCNPRVGVRA